MKRYLLPFALSLMACSEGNPEIRAIGKIGNLNIQKNYAFEYQDNYSLACNLCLIADSLENIDQLIKLRDTVKFVDGNYVKKEASFSEIKDLLRLKVDIGKELKKYMDQFASYSAKDLTGNSVNMFRAKEECISKHGYFNVVNQGKRDTLFLTYSSYLLHSLDLPIYNGPLDTSTIPKTPAGDYITTYRGDTNIIEAAYLTAHFDNVLEKYYAAWDHVHFMRAQLVLELTGMDPSQMSPMQKVIFKIQMSEARGRIHIFHNPKPDLKLDKLREDLIQAFQN